MGVSVVNALSAGWRSKSPGWQVATASASQRGEPVTRLEQVGATEADGDPDPLPTRSRDFPETLEFEAEIDPYRLRELAFLNRSVSFIFIDERTSESTRFQYDGGIALLRGTPEPKQGGALHPTIHFEQTVGDAPTWRWPSSTTPGYGETMFTLANNIHTRRAAPT